MSHPSQLPNAFLIQLRALEAAYLQSDDPRQQSGFGGGAERWRAEREPILEAIRADGDLLDVGCANGFLAESLVKWGLERGIVLRPYGVDRSRRLVELARQRRPSMAANFYVGEVWEWEPPRRFRYVYALHDCVPLEYLGAYVRRLVSRVVAPGGRLIVGAYGSRSRKIVPLDVAGCLRSAGLKVTGQSQGGAPSVTSFAWVDASYQDMPTAPGTETDRNAGDVACSHHSGSEMGRAGGRTTWREDRTGVGWRRHMRVLGGRRR